MKSTLKFWSGGMKQRIAGSTASGAKAKPKSQPLAGSSASAAKAKPKSQPKAKGKRGPDGRGSVMFERLRTKFLKNESSALDILEDAVGIWTSGVEAGDVHEARLT